MSGFEASWGGVRFQAVNYRDGRMLRAPGLFAFIRRDARNGPLMLFAGQSEDIAQAAGPGHAAWADALALGMDELQVHLPVPRRIDRLQLLARVIQRAEPLLNVLDEAHPPPAQQDRRWGVG